MGCCASEEKKEEPKPTHSRSSSLRRAATFINHQGLRLSRTPPGTGRRPMNRSQSTHDLKKHQRNLTHCGIRVLPVFTANGVMPLEIPVMDDPAEVKTRSRSRSPSKNKSDSSETHSGFKRTESLEVPKHLLSRERASTDERRKKPTTFDTRHVRADSRFMDEMDARLVELRRKQAAEKSEKYRASIDVRNS